MLLGAAIAAPAHAALPSATAELKNIHIELIDLDPLDGVVPSAQFVSSIEFSEPGSSSLIFGYSYPYPAHASPWSDTLAPAGKPLYGFSVGGLPGSAVEVSVGAGDLFASVGGPSVRANGTQAAGGFLIGLAKVGGNLMLSAHTRLVMSAEVGEVSVKGGPLESASASIYLCPAQVTDGWPCFDSSTVSDVSLQSAAAYENTDIAGNLYAQHADRISVSWDNLGAAPETRWLEASAYITLYTQTAPVPEPQSIALWSLGLASLASVARRRRPRFA
jgi:hypothetical protein